jgi:hypothetical protein
MHACSYSTRDASRTYSTFPRRVSQGLQESKVLRGKGPRELQLFRQQHQAGSEPRDPKISVLKLEIKFQVPGLESFKHVAHGMIFWTCKLRTGQTCY